MHKVRSVVAAAGLLFGVSCGSEELPTDRQPTEGGIAIFGDALTGTIGDGGELQVCPSAPPKLGERCGPGFDETTSCELPVNECQMPGGGGLIDTIIFCCPDGVWESCGGRSPCDGVAAPDAAAPARDGGVPDAPAAPADAGVDAAGDAGLDAEPDASADVAADLAPDLTPDLEPDVAPDTGVDAADDAAADA